MENDSRRVAVAGASGYAGEELIRLLLRHPHVELVRVTSRQHQGKTLGEVFPRFARGSAAAGLKFTDTAPDSLGREADAVFLALPHGVSGELGATLVEQKKRVIDLSADFRLRHPELYREFYGAHHPAPNLLGRAVYGLPELYRAEIARADLVACPGCYPTSILIPLRPFIRRRAIDRQRIVITSLSGVTGAGRKVEADYLFAECNENLRAYGVPKHRHLSEIEQELSLLAGESVTVQFTPHLVPVNRGIITTIYADIGAEVVDLDPNLVLQSAYAEEPFVRLLGEGAFPQSRNVLETNFIDIAVRLDPRTNRLVILSAIDNLTKGTSGQAVQCFNLMFGYPETTGLL